MHHEGDARYLFQRKSLHSSSLWPVAFDSLGTASSFALAFISKNALRCETPRELMWAGCHWKFVTGPMTLALRKDTPVFDNLAGESEGMVDFDPKKFEKLKHDGRGQSVPR